MRNASMYRLFSADRLSLSLKYRTYAMIKKASANIRIVVRSLYAFESVISNTRYPIALTPKLSSDPFGACITIQFVLRQINVKYAMKMETPSEKSRKNRLRVSLSKYPNPKIENNFNIAESSSKMNAKRGENLSMASVKASIMKITRSTLTRS